MIKIDLQQGIIEEGSIVPEEEIALKQGLQSAAYVVFKLFVLIIFSLGLYIYEQKELNLLKAILKKAQNTEQKIKQKISQTKISINKLKETKKEYINLQEKVITAKDIVKFKFSFVKAIGVLQKIRPETVWFKEIVYEKKLLNIKGHAISKKVLNKFVKDVREQANSKFKDSILETSKQEQMKGVGVRSFHLKITLL